MMTRRARIAEALAGQRIDTLELSPGATLMLTITGEQADRLAEAVDEAIEDPPTEPQEPSTDASARIRQSVSAAAQQPPSPAAVTTPTPGGLSYQPPRTSGTEFSPGVQRFMEDNRISPVLVHEVIKNPDDTWLGHNPKAGDRPTVAVKNDHRYGVVYYPDDAGAYVISVELVSGLYQKRRSLTSGFRSAGGGGAKRAPVLSLRDLITAAESNGLEFSQGKTHGQVRDPDRPELGFSVVPLTPSDVRSWANCTAELRRRFGVEL